MARAAAAGAAGLALVAAAAVLLLVQEDRLLRWGLAPALLAWAKQQQCTHDPAVAHTDEAARNDRLFWFMQARLAASCSPGSLYSGDATHPRQS